MLPWFRAWTPRERKAAGTLAAAWTLGVAAGWSGLDRSLAKAAEAALHPPRPSVAELAASVGPGDPRPGWYAAALALREEEAVAESGPTRIDPNAAGRAEWDRLPGIGPVTAIAIVEHRGARGPFGGPEDLLAVRGIGPRTLEKLEPFLDCLPRPRVIATMQSCLRMIDCRISSSWTRHFSQNCPGSVQNLLKTSCARGEPGGRSATGRISCRSKASVPDGLASCRKRPA